jgi:hypothetical protein
LILHKTLDPGLRHDDDSTGAWNSALERLIYAFCFLERGLQPTSKTSSYGLRHNDGVGKITKEAVIASRRRGNLDQCIQLYEIATVTAFPRNDGEGVTNKSSHCEPQARQSHDVIRVC